jgi:hypothetical protein
VPILVPQNWFPSNNKPISEKPFLLFFIL